MCVRRGQRLPINRRSRERDGCNATGVNGSLIARGTQQALLDKKFISQNAFDNVQSNYDVAAAKLRAAEADLTMAKKSLGDSVLVAPFSGIVAQRHAQPGERIPLDAKIISVMDLSRLELEAAVPAAEIQTWPGWGHDFPAGMIPTLIERIVKFCDGK